MTTAPLGFLAVTLSSGLRPEPKEAGLEDTSNGYSELGPRVTQSFPKTRFSFRPSLPGSLGFPSGSRGSSVPHGTQVLVGAIALVPEVSSEHSRCAFLAETRTFPPHTHKHAAKGFAWHPTHSRYSINIDSSPPDMGTHTRTQTPKTCYPVGPRVW